MNERLIVRGISGREDWDYVSMENYSKDMEEAGNQAAHIIGQQAKEIRELKRLVELLIYCAFQPIEIPNFLLQRDLPITIERVDRPDLNSVIFRRYE